MSLLLDALKKAAQDKIARSEPKDESRNGTRQNIARSGSAMQNKVGSKSRSDPAASLNAERASERDANPVVEPRAIDTSHAPDAAAGNNEGAEQAFEFTLDDIDAVVTDTGDVPDVTDKPAEERAKHAAATHTTITDEALRLLISKTNSAYRKRQFVIWSGVVFGAVLMLLLAGAYMYVDMNRELESMERKNRLALAALAAQTKIEENLTSLATPVERDEDVAVQQPAPASEVRPISKPAAATKTAAKQTLTLVKTEQRDPVSLLLNRGWNAFQRGDYDSASTAYNEVLQREARNRDALLGVAAIAVQRGETEKARDYYISLLQLDPLDSHAHAGLANIARTDGAVLNEQRLKQLIDKQPDDPHLKFVLGNYYAQQNKWPQAQQAYFSAWQGDSENADYAFNLAVSLDHLKKNAEAERFYELSLRFARNANTGFAADAVEKRLRQLRSGQQK